MHNLGIEVLCNCVKSSVCFNFELKSQINIPSFWLILNQREKSWIRWPPRTSSIDELCVIWVLRYYAIASNPLLCVDFELQSQKCSFFFVVDLITAWKSCIHWPLRTSSIDALCVIWVLRYYAIASNPLCVLTLNFRAKKFVPSFRVKVFAAHTCGKQGRNHK